MIGGDPRGLKLLGLGMAVVGLAVLPYLQTARFGPTYDDHAHVIRNAFVQHPENIRFLLSLRYLELELPDQNRPVLLATLFLDRAWFGDWFGGYHLQSAAWHGLATLLAFVLAVRLRLGPWPATAGAALFALHPVCTEAVAAVSNREDPLATVFVLATLLAARAFLRGQWFWLPVAALSFAVALGAKESAMATPLLVGALAAASPEWRAADRPRARWLALAGAAAVPLAAFAAFQLRLGAPSLTLGAGGSPLETVPLAPLAAWLWLGRSLATDGLGWAHSIPVELHRFVRVMTGWPLSAEHDPSLLEGGGAIALGAFGLLVMTAAGVWLHRREPRYALGLTWFAAATIPVMAVPWLLDPIADRLLYLPAVGVSIALGSALARPRHPPWSRLVWIAFLAVFTAQTTSRVTVWRDDATLFADVVQHAPRSARAWQNLGAAHLQQGRLTLAEEALERAVELDPSLLAAHLNLALVALRRADRARAVEHLGRAVRIPVIRGEQQLHSRAFRLYLGELDRLGRRSEREEALRAERARLPDSELAGARTRDGAPEPPSNE